MDVVEAMVRCRYGNQAAGSAERRKAIAFGKIRHEFRNARARRRLVPANRNIMLRLRTPFARHHDEFAISAPDAQHVLGRTFVEFAVQPAQKIGRRRLAQPVLGRQSIDLGLQANMGSRFDLQITALLVLGEIARRARVRCPSGACYAPR